MPEQELYCPRCEKPVVGTCGCNPPDIVVIDVATQLEQWAEWHETEAALWRRQVRDEIAVKRPRMADNATGHAEAHEHSSRRIRAVINGEPMTPPPQEPINLVSATRRGVQKRKRK